MLIREEADGDGWLAIGQASHAWLSGQLARAWGSAAVERPEPFEAVCLAAEQHDVGMAEWDRRPALDAATGRAMAFTAMPRPLHLDLWTRAAAKLETQSRYAALLVSMHGTWLYRSFVREDTPAIRAYLDGQAAYQAALIERLEADPAAVERNRRLVACWDALSLALCLGWAARELPPVPGTEGQDVVLRYAPAGAGAAVLDPWPFAADRVTVEAEGRRLSGGFTAEAELHAALDAAPASRLEWTLRAATPGARPG